MTHANVAQLLARLGATLDDVADKVRRQAYGAERSRLASNLIGVARLALPEQLIEITLTAGRGDVTSAA